MMSRYGKIIIIFGKKYLYRKTLDEKINVKIVRFKTFIMDNE